MDNWQIPPSTLPACNLDWKLPSSSGACGCAVANTGAKARASAALDDNSSAANKGIYDAVGDIKGYGLSILGGTYPVSKNVSLNANIFNLLNKDFP